MTKYNEVVMFIETNKQNPSKYDAEERGKYGLWLKHNRKQHNNGDDAAPIPAVAPTRSLIPSADAAPIPADAPTRSLSRSLSRQRKTKSKSRMKMTRFIRQSNDDSQRGF